jgi:hypothetical protein
MSVRNTTDRLRGSRYGLRFRRAWQSALLLGVGALLLATGCAAPGVPHDDIVTVYHFYRVEPWLRDEVGRVNGLSTRVYFVPAGGKGGCFVPGLIKAQVFSRDRRPDGTYARTPAYEWSFDQPQAAGFRIVKRSELGDSYGFVLRWPPELDLGGREIEVRFSYVRQDGRTIVGRGTPLAVPLATGQIPAGSATAPVGQPATRPVPPPKRRGEP